jgi:hypothetical protein
MKATALAAKRKMDQTGTTSRHLDIAREAFQSLRKADARTLTDWINIKYPHLIWDDYESVRRACDLEKAQDVRDAGRVGKSRKGNPATVWEWIVTGPAIQPTLFE